MSSIRKLNHAMIAEQSIQNFIEYLEDSSGEAVPEAHKEWLFEKGNEIFEAYYVDNHFQIALSTEEAKNDLEAYFTDVQKTLGRMFAHIMLTEYKLFILGA